MRTTAAVIIAAFFSAVTCVHAQTPRATAPGRAAGTLMIGGQTDEAPLLRINGRRYVDVEDVVRMTHASMRFQGNRIILTLPQTGAAGAAQNATAAKSPELSQGFLAAQIEALTQLREWRISLVNAVQNNYPVTEDWVGKLRRSAETRLQLASAASKTEPDRQALQLLQGVFGNMQQLSEQFLAQHASATYTSPDSFVNNTLDKKVLACERALMSMAATKQFADDPACH